MAQGYTGYNIIENAITIKDSANLDAFSRLRVSNPLTIFSNQFTYDLSPLVFEELQNGVNGLITWSSVDRYVLFELGVAPIGEYAFMQSYEYIPYQPGRSQLVFITFNMNLIPPITNHATRVVGLGDTSDGFFFKYNAASAQFEFVIQSSSGAGTQIVPQSSWNLDKLNGSGPSGITFDGNATQILVLDFQALYVGRVRFGFDIGGEIIYAHEFLHANIFSSPYIATANLPIRVGIESTTNDPSMYEYMAFICCSVASEGGLEDSQRFGYNFAYNNSKLTVPATLSYIATIRPTATFNGITNRTKFVLEEIEILNTGNRPLYWQLGIGQKLIGTSYSPVNTTYSGMEVSTTGTTTTLPSLVFDSGYIASGAGVKSQAGARLIQSKYPITLNAAGAPRNEGTISLYANGIGGTTDIYYVLKWKEIR